MGAGENTKAELLLCNPSRADDLRMALVAAAVLMAETRNVEPRRVFMPDYNGILLFSVSSF